MVFGNLDETDNMEVSSRMQAVRAANVIKILGKGVIRVVHRIDDAKENSNLDLSNCQLMQVPDAVYFMMRNTQVESCDLSANVIKKIPPKLPTKFSFIKHLNLSDNRLSTLPVEISELNLLESVDISRNSFVKLPSCLFELSNLKSIHARKNFVMDVEIQVLDSLENQLEEINLEENPISKNCREVIQLRNSNEDKKISIKISASIQDPDEDWDNDDFSVD